ncbi:outer membrane beta-barrel protein [Aurantibacillus circumpalustris]|uniref:outer membrane beta-barrel protein n=1 Tax=Aurantibacillus circumpalustris TaxID=3036359 RepID=UPI00295A999E|nr:outer membrane beta-barrel protein [Aurantibacillus circumpalustris]
MIRFITLAWLLLSCYKLSSQSVAGRVLDSLNAPVAFVPVAMLNAKDSAIYKVTVTTENGYFSFENLNPGSYMLKFSAMGFEEKIESTFQLDSNVNMETGFIRLKNLKGVDLAEVSVSTLKRAFEFKNGNIIVNVENSALAAGNSAYDLIIKLPGVAVNEDGISIQGRNGVKVMINDRIQQVSYRQLVNILKGISGSSIEKIEVLKNPPVKYDAAGTAGLINIKTKKIRVVGFNGNASLSGSQGFYPGGEANLSLNYKTKRFVLFGDVSTGYGKFFSANNFNRIITYDSITSDLNQKQLETELDFEFMINAGVDWQLNEKNIIGAKITIEPGNEASRSVGQTFFNDGSIYDRMNYDNTMLNVWNYINYNVNAEHLFDTLGSKLIFSVDYSPNWDDYKGGFDHRFLNGNDEVSDPRVFKTFLREDLNLLSAKLDFESPLSESTEIQAGIKVGSQELRKKYVFENNDITSGEYILDTNYSNQFNYKEQILAAYFNIEKDFDILELSLGVRAENTRITMNSPDKNFKKSQDYFNLFPVISIEAELNKNNNIELSYNKRINRPESYAFYPYKFVWGNLLTGSKGNPNVLPENSHGFELTHVYKQVVSNALAYSHVNNYLLNYTLQNDSSKEIIEYISNIKNSQTLGYTLFCELKLKNWWVLSGNITLSYLSFKGKVNDIDYSTSGYSSSAMLRNELILSKKSKIEIIGQYVGAQPLGVFVVQPRWSINLAYKIKVLKEKLDVVVGLDDIFYTFINRNRVSFQNQHWTISQRNDSRRFRISLSYNFGKIKVERRDLSSNEDEKDRMKH